MVKEAIALADEFKIAELKAQQDNRHCTIGFPITTRLAPLRKPN